MRVLKRISTRQNRKPTISQVCELDELNKSLSNIFGPVIDNIKIYDILHFYNDIKNFKTNGLNFNNKFHYSIINSKINSGHGVDMIPFYGFVLA